MGSRGSFVILPEGAEVTIKLREEHLDLFVREEIKKQVAEAMRNRYLNTSAGLRALVGQASKEYIQTAAADGTLRELIKEIVVEWLEAREGWVAKMLRRR